MQTNYFKIRIDRSGCNTLTSDSFCIGRNKLHDTWYHTDLEFSSGKIYALVSEYGQGCMYLSYLLGGMIDFGNLRIYKDQKQIARQDLLEISWNLEPNETKFKNQIIEKSIRKALKSSLESEQDISEKFSQIQDKFLLTQERLNRKFCQLSAERWRASAALGYALRKKIFFAPYQTSSFYFQMSQSCLLKAFHELTQSGCMIVLPIGSDDFAKHFVDECIYLNRDFPVEQLEKQYSELFQSGNWIHE